MVVLVTGASGQLGQALQFISNEYPQLEFVFCTSQMLDVTNLTSCEAVFEKFRPAFCVNAAAYTAVDKAESESESAHRVNTDGAKNMALVCRKYDTVLLHISTDFVFDGEKNAPYTETDLPHPTGIYGQTKLDGEAAVTAVWEKHFIIRTSWVYSQFGHNFMKTMLRLGAERDSLAVVSDQIGTPTHAVDLAQALVTIMLSRQTDYGIYNFSGEGECSWFDFASEIFRVSAIDTSVKPIATSDYPTAARRPKYSVLDKSKIKEVFAMDIKNWKESLKQHFPK